MWVVRQLVDMVFLRIQKSSLLFSSTRAESTLRLAGQARRKGDSTMGGLRVRRDRYDPTDRPGAPRRKVGSERPDRPTLRCAQRSDFSGRSDPTDRPFAARSAAIFWVGVTRPTDPLGGWPGTQIIESTSSRLKRRYEKFNSSRQRQTTHHSHIMSHIPQSIS